MTSAHLRRALLASPAVVCLTLVFLAIVSLAVVFFATPAAGQTVRIVQTNAAGDNVHLIDPATNEVVDVILGIPIPHGVTSHPDGSALYFSNEVDHTLDVVPTKTLRVAKKIPLTGRPNNISITPDGRKMYVAITGRDAFVDVIDLEAGRVVKSIPTLGGVHNVYVTPDGRHLVAGMIGARTLTVVDTETDEPVWSVHFDGGVRPMILRRTPTARRSGSSFRSRATTASMWLTSSSASWSGRSRSRSSPYHGWTTTRSRALPLTVWPSRRTDRSSGPPASPTTTCTPGRSPISSTSEGSRWDTIRTGSP